MVLNFRWIVILTLALAVAEAREEYEQVLKRYQEFVKRRTLRKRTFGRQRLADTEDDRALAVLKRDYQRPGKPAHQTKYLIAHMIGEAFADESHADMFVEWRRQFSKPMDAWLWYRTLLAHHENKGPDDLVAIAKKNHNVFLRCSAIEALRLRFDPIVLKLTLDLCKRLPEKPAERAVMLESLAAAISVLKDLKAKPEFREPAEALFKQMDRPTTLKRTKIVMGRYFARLFKTRVWTNGQRWSAELAFVQSGGKVASQEGYNKKKKPTFAGIEANGDHICYVIDMSDSMMAKLSPKELEKLPKGPVTGASALRRASKSDAWKKAFERVKWRNVKTRFDAARELVKVSLLGLEEHQSFCVIWFGDKAAALKSTRGLVKATSGNVQKVFRELDAIKGRPRTANRPEGVLRGTTNMHGALHRAFKIKGKGIVGEGEYVDLRTWKGCDVIFILSDGAPSWDDWAGLDKRDPWNNVGDPESGIRSANQDAETGNFAGPYAQINYLISDVRRLNLFRKAEIHCVGLGEANMSLLERLAGIGIGQAISLKDGGK